MAGGEAIQQPIGPMTASESLVETWVGSMPDFIDQGKKPVILEYRFNISGLKKVFVLVPPGMNIGDLAQISSDEKVMMFTNAVGQREGANPQVVSDNQAELLFAAGAVDLPFSSIEQTRSFFDTNSGSNVPFDSAQGKNIR